MPVKGSHQHLINLRDKGAAILLISADLEEIMTLSDRIAVLFKGEIIGHFIADTIDEKELGLYMLGAKRQPNATALLNDNKDIRARI